MIKDNTHTIEIVFENTDSVTISTENESFHPYISITGLKQDIHVSHFNGIMKSTISEYVRLVINKSSLVSEHTQFYDDGFSSSDDPEFNAWEVLKTYKSIAAIIIDPKNSDDDECIYVPWDSKLEYENNFEHIEVNDEDDLIVITIEKTGE